MVVAEDPALVGLLPDGTLFAAADVPAERLLLGQGLLDEPGDAPAGWRLARWLSQTLGTAGQTGSGWTAADVPPGAVGTPESVKPVYVRSPDADVHITKMRDPWAAHPGGGRSGRR